MQHAGEKYRGWSIAVAQGLFLMNVMYPEHADPQVLCHPDIEHDEFGRPLVGSSTGKDSSIPQGSLNVPITSLDTSTAIMDDCD